MTETAAPPPNGRIVFPRGRIRPFAALRRRVIVAVSLLTLVAMVAFLDRGGYRDSAGGDVGFLDAFYYATVSITTTGYGDIVPVTDRARLLTTLVITPARVLFLIILVGTTLELLAERGREAFLQQRWRMRVRDHFIICGFGTKGRSAATVLIGQGVDPDRIVAIDTDPFAMEQASAMGIVAIAGNAQRSGVLQQAGVERARAVVVAPHRDDTAVLITLTSRELNPAVTIVASAREAENVHLLRQSGARSVITSAEAAGRLLGRATQYPRLVEVLEDLLTAGQGLDLVEKEATVSRIDDVSLPANSVLVAVIRNGAVLRFNDERARDLERGDRLIYLTAPAPRRDE